MSLPSEQRRMKSSTRTTSAAEGYAYSDVKSPVQKGRGCMPEVPNDLPRLLFLFRGRMLYLILPTCVQHKMIRQSLFVSPRVAWIYPWLPLQANDFPVHYPYSARQLVWSPWRALSDHSFTVGALRALSHASRLATPTSKLARVPSPE